MTRTLKILIVMVAGNSRAHLAAAARGALATGYELLVIDSGGDQQILQKAIADLPCRIMHSAEQCGRSAAVLLAAEHAANHGYDTLITINGDGRHDPADIRFLVAKAEKCPSPCLVLGVSPASGQAVSWSDHVGRSWTHSCVRLACGLELPDPESGFRLYPVKELLALAPTLSRFGFAIETVVKFAWAGIPVSTVAVSLGQPSKYEQLRPFGKMTRTLGLAWLHGRLLLRRLLPWPHKKLTKTEPLRKQIRESLSHNPIKVLGKICREHSSPLWLAMAVWLGIFMGALPLLAIHTVSILYVAHRLHINKVAAVAASQFCMPPVVPVLCIQVGYYLRNGEFLYDFSWQRWLLGVHERLWEWFLGSLLLGPLLGLFGAVVMYWMAARLQHQKEMKPPADA